MQENQPDIIKHKNCYIINSNSYLDAEISKKTREGFQRQTNNMFIEINF